MLWLNLPLKLWRHLRFRVLPTKFLVQKDTPTTNSAMKVVALSSRKSYFTLFLCAAQEQAWEGYKNYKRCKSFHRDGKTMKSQRKCMREKFHWKSMNYWKNFNKLKSLTNLKLYAIMHNKNGDAYSKRYWSANLIWNPQRKWKCNKYTSCWAWQEYWHIVSWK